MDKLQILVDKNHARKTKYECKLRRGKVSLQTRLLIEEVIEDCNSAIYELELFREEEKTETLGMADFYKIEKAYVWAKINGWEYFPPTLSGEELGKWFNKNHGPLGRPLTTYWLHEHFKHGTSK